MSTSLAAQLHRIAAKSTNSLDLKAQRTAHSQSLIFEPKLAATQDFDTIFQICREGFQELCLLDARFVGFGRSIFSEHSKSQERTQMTAGENGVLDRALEDFMGLIGGRLILKPALKSMEWLVRRFRVHEYNLSCLLLTFLPYHTAPMFPTLLSILPTNIPLAFKFLHPYIKSLVSPPRHTIVYSATNNIGFFTALNAHVLRMSKARFHYRALSSFWAGITTEAVAGMLDNTRSGRNSVQRQNQQDVLLRILPFLNEALTIEKAPDLKIGCYMLMTVIASKSSLEDDILVTMMEAVTAGWTQDTAKAALICLSIMAQEREALKLPKAVFKAIMTIDNLEDELLILGQQCRMDRLTLGLVLGCISQLGKKQKPRLLSFVKKMLDQSILDDSQAFIAVEAALKVAQSFDLTSKNGTELQSQLADLLARLTDSTAIGGITQRAIKRSGLDVGKLEATLQIVIRAPDPPAAESVVDDEVPDAVSKFGAECIEMAIESIPTRTAYEVSFLSHSKSYVFGSLSHAFIMSATSASNVETFTELPVLRKGLALSEPFYFTFFVRIWCGEYPVQARTAALEAVSRYFSSGESPLADVQALVPYILAALADSSTKVRRAASEVLVELGQMYKKIAGKNHTEIKIWGIEDIYGQGEETKSIKWISIEETGKILEKVLLPGLEEFVLDSDHIARSVEYALGDTPHSRQIGSKSPTADIKTSLRVAFLSFLSSHITNTPLYAVKLRLLTFLKRVDKVGTSSRTKVLLPLLHLWVSGNDNNRNQCCKTEGIDPAEMDSAIVAMVSAYDRDGIHTLQSIITGEVETTSPSIIKAASERIRTIWPMMKADLQLTCAESLLDLSLTSSSNAASQYRQNMATDTLRSVRLTTNVLVLIVDKLPSAAVNAGDKAPAVKRRRTSNGEVAAMNPYDAKELAAAIQKITFVLELIDSSKPETHPQLLQGLFHVLGELQLLKSQTASDLAYLHSLVLGSLLAVVDSFKNGAVPKLDRAAVRVDLLVDCIRSTANPQVQKAALLLVGSLATVAPELVLHSIMPVFTFMGASVLRQGDEYSAYVIDQTIEQVVPYLVDAMKKQNRDVLSGSSELLLSFVAAFEHIPWHRRLTLFDSLIKKLGPEDFLFALLAMLADKYAVNKSVQDFAVDLMARFTPEVQLLTARKYLDLVFDALRPKRTISELLLNIGVGGERSAPEVVHDLLKLLPRLLGTRRLSSGIFKRLQQDDMDAARLRDNYSSLLERTLNLTRHFQNEKQLSLLCGRLLDTLLALLSTTEYIASIDKLLQSPDVELRRKILRSLEVRIRNYRAEDQASRNALLKFLPKLTAILRESFDVPLKLAALDCIDQISEKFGKKDKTAIANAAEVVSSAQCLGNADDRLCVLALLCLASMVEVLGHSMVPVLPEALPRAFEHLQKSMKEDTENERLHNAVYSFVGALLIRVPWIMTGGYLDSILKLSHESSNADMGESCDHTRIETLHLLAKQTNVKDLFVSLDKNWSSAVTEGPQAVKEHLSVLSGAIEKQPKSIIVNNSSSLTSIFLKAFDLRRIQFSPRTDESYDDDEVEVAETAINEVAIKMIYKMNDTTFRPLFTRLLQWASTDLPKRDKKGKRLRLTSLFTFLGTFFDTLKSIVTGYATYIIEMAVDTLDSVDPKDSESVILTKSVLRTLHTAFEHDQDGKVTRSGTTEAVADSDLISEFWQSPSHFKAISGPLISQLRHASTVSTESEIIPAITELAIVADSAENHKEMNAAIMKYMRSDEVQVRLAAVKCEQSLTVRLGEEWLALLPEMLPFISELQEDDDEVVERETHRWIVNIEGILGESLDLMLQ
ncbi:MAG: snoRNA-binding rRNA-processing protein utp10 [Pleopsidium flavum]|nr:MAG: snoRNA-binding rRNA-processing protein utp10 [Pleopsidium flavum]